MVQHSGPPGERPLQLGHYLYGAGLASLVVSLLLLVRHIWRNNPRLFSIVLLLLVGAGLPFIGIYRGASEVNNAFAYAGSSLMAFATLLAARNLWSRWRSPEIETR
jgi:drug/metabolite transporter (DMT)-like permease